MNTEIHISKVPLTPAGVNYDFKAVKKYEFVRLDESAKIRTKVLMDPESYLSDNEVDLNELETNEQKVEAIIKSPMIEVRKKRQSNSLNNGDIRFNPKRDDILETSLGCYNNYRQNRRKTIGVTRRRSSTKQDTPKRRHSLPESISLFSKKENSDPKSELELELNLLVAAVDHSQTLLSVERKRLSDMIVDWSHIIEIEKDIPLENQGDIESAIGGIKILLDKRFKSTLDLLDSAEKYVNSNGVLTDDNEKHYRSQDIYGFVDLLLDEIKKIDGEFNKLLNLRNNNWISISQEITQVRKAPVVKKKPIKIKKESRLNIKNIRREFNKTGKKSVSVEICLVKKGNNVEKSQENGINHKIDVGEENRKNRNSIGNNRRKSSLQLNPEIPMDGTTNNEKEINQTEKVEEGAKNTENEILITPTSFSKPTNRPKSILKSPRRNSKFNTSNNEKVTFTSNINPTESNEIDVSINTSSNDSSNMIKTPPSSIKTGIRSKSLLKSNTGTPVHNDTPRPRRSCHKTSEFAMPSLNNVVSKKFHRKKSVNTSNHNEESINTCPIPIPKKIRKSNK